MRKFKRAQAQNQASIEKHLLADNSPNSSSDDDDDNRDSLLRAVAKVVSSYQGEGGDTEKSLSYLTDIFQSGGAICLICISSVKKTDPIWSCSTCFSFMHLSCVQHWIRDSLRYKREKGITPLWACPKCRTEHREDEIPERYVCFCGQRTDPSYEPWAIPHSCGEKCDKPLRPACGHHCLLLCHPGACPPCPKMVRAGCLCGKEPAEPRRCNAKEWSCGKICLKKLSSCEHNCREVCHAGPCPPCSVILSVSCRCGASTAEERLCSEASRYCDKRCGKTLPCKIHVCEGRCHRSSGVDCGECPTEKYCPCGKRRYSGVLATCHDVVPTCGDTCGKLLDCGSHRCNARCHPDRCGSCLEVLAKRCRCRSYEKEVACAKEFYCNKKCPQMRTCGKHACNKKCCDCLLRNSFKVCERTCDSTLNCQRHKCSAPCHSGPCYPCPRTNSIQCRCGNSKITVPCGRKNRIKPPSCNKICKIPPVCRHTKQTTHKCHHGPCPPCRKTCNLINEKCAHPCPAVCHTKRPTSERPPSASVLEKSRTRLKNLPCPPCEVSVTISCFGRHETTNLPCHRATSYSCQRPCGRLLGCTNHTCEIPCHRVAATLDDPNSESCPACERPCSLPRPEGCSHPCPRFCHRGPCNPCNHLVKVSCYCGINSLYKRCAQLTTTTTSSDERVSLECGNRCPKNYPCGHRCVENCHSGECPNAEGCAKRVKVRCDCKRIRKETSCVESRKHGVRLECDETCRRIQKDRERVGEMEAASKRREEEARDRMEVERFERKFNRRRGGARERMPLKNDEDDRDRPLKKFVTVLGGSLLLLIAIAVFYANKRHD